METRKVVVVTGASAGVGRATVRAFAKSGYDVALIARGVDGLEGARREVEALGRRALVLPLDVADADAVEVAARTTEETLGPIERSMIAEMLSCTVVGTRDVVRRGLAELAEATGADELMVVAQIHDHAARLRSYEIAAETLA